MGCGAGTLRDASAVEVPSEELSFHSSGLTTVGVAGKAHESGRSRVIAPVRPRTRARPRCCTACRPGVARAKSGTFREVAVNGKVFCGQNQKVVCQKVFGMHRCSPSAPRRLHTSPIDVKLREDVAETIERRSMPSSIKKNKNDATGVGPRSPRPNVGFQQGHAVYNSKIARND